MKHVFKLVLILLLLLNAPPALAEDALQTGLDLMHEGRYWEAIDQFKKSIRQRHAKGAVRKATHTSVKGLKMLGDLTISMVSLGEVDGVFSYSNLHDASDSSGRASAAANIAICYCNLKNYREARSWARKALKLNQSIDTAHCTLGRVEAAKNNHWNAIDEYNLELHSSSNNSGRANTYYRRSLSYDALGLDDRAIEDRTKAAELDDRFLTKSSVKKAVNELESRKKDQAKQQKDDLKREREIAEQEYLEKQKRRRQAIEGE